MTYLSDADLQAFLDEALPADQMSIVEGQMRNDASLRERLSLLRGQQDAGMHSIAAIWRRHRASCPSREQLGQYLLGVMDDAEADYVDFHTDQVGCRFCQANLDDLRRQQAEASEPAQARKRKYFQTSVGHLKK